MTDKHKCDNNKCKIKHSEYPVPLAEDVKAFKWLNTKQAVIEIELCFKQDYYNKAMAKHNWEHKQLSDNNKQSLKVN